MTEILIERLGHQGDGIGQGPSGPVYVPFSLPGELVEGEISSDRIQAPSVKSPSSHRVKAPCPHFRACGGCALQHASDGFLETWKTEVVKTALEAQGLFAPFRAIMVSPAKSRRRATLAGRRTKTGAIIGFHGRASGSSIGGPNCVLLDEHLLAAFPVFEDLVRIGASRKGEVSIAATVSGAGLDVDVSDAKPCDAAMLTELGQLAGRNRIARLSWNGEVIATLDQPIQKFGRAVVTPPPGAFLQATIGGEAALIETVREVIEGSRVVADLFSGCGTFSLPVAETSEVHAVEGDAGQIAALDKGWRNTPGMKSLTSETRDLFRRPLLAEELSRYDAIIIDPPRAGAVAQTREIARSTVERIAFVSCNPATFARDARVMSDGGYRLDWVQVVDQFRWSPHVELVAQFTKGQRPAT